MNEQPTGASEQADPEYETWAAGICSSCQIVVECGDAQRFQRFKGQAVDYAWRCTNVRCVHSVPVATPDQDTPDWCLSFRLKDGTYLRRELEGDYYKWTPPKPMRALANKGGPTT